MPDASHVGSAAARIRVLFVDDETSVLDGLRRAMYSMRGVWDMTFCASAIEALQTMSHSVPDVVISDMRMPGMNGAELLGEVKRLYPQVVRFILSGYAESQSVMRVAGTAHQYLSKPCDSGVLKLAISRTVALREMLGSDVLLQRIGDVDSLPSLPQVYQEIVACLQGPDPTIADVSRIISQDVVMTTMVLKLANSAFFGAKQTFKTADRAVSFLGINTISALVLAHSIFNDSKVVETAGLSIPLLWMHSVQTATNARRLARHEGWSAEQAEEAFLAGMLHDVGRLVLATREATEPAGAASWDEAHAKVGAYLLGLWGFSDIVVEAIAFHHVPSRAAGGFGLAGLLHVADRLAHQNGDEADAVHQTGFETGYLESLGLAERIDQWQAASATAEA